MKAFPAHINLNDRPVLIIGGGAEALAKARLMLASGADLALIAATFAPETEAELEGRARLSLCRWSSKSFYSGMLSCFFHGFCAFLLRKDAKATLSLSFGKSKLKRFGRTLTTS